MLVTVKLILHLFLIGDGKLRKVQNSAPPPELPDSLLWDLKERDVDSLRGSVRRIKFEIKHHTSALVFTLFKTIKSFIHFITHTEFLESSISSHDYFSPSSLLSFHIKWNLQMCPASVFILTLKKWEAPVTAARQQITEIQNFHFLLKSEASLIFPFHNLHFLISSNGEWKMEATGTELWITGSTLRADAKVAQHCCAFSAPASTECPSLQSGLGNNSTFSVECLACILVPCSFSLAHKGPFSIWRLIIPTFCKRLKAKGNQGHKFRCNRRGHRLKPKGL